MKYSDYKKSKENNVEEKVHKPQPLCINTQEEYMIHLNAVNEYINQRFENGDYEFTEEDFKMFEENLDECWEDLMYSDEDFPKCKMEEILDCAKVLGWGPKSIKDAKNTIYELFETCMNMGCPKMTSETGGWVVKCDIADHSVLVYWKVGDASHYDDEDNW